VEEVGKRRPKGRIKKVNKGGTEVLG